MPFGFPVCLELAGRPVVVIGEGAVAGGKVDGVLAAGADRVLVLAEGPPRRLSHLDADARVRVERRGWHPDDLDGALLVIAARADPRDNAALHREGRARGALVNVMDDVSNCDWAAPAVVRRGDLVIALSTGGRSPALARRLREELSVRYGPEWAAALDLLGEVRDETLPALPDVSERSRRWRSALDCGELVALVRDGQRDRARSLLIGRLLAGEVSG